MSKPKIVRKKISDLGVAAYLLMFGHTIGGRQGRNVFFDVKEEDIPEFDKLCFEYHGSSFSKFDLHLMSIKKMSDYMSPDPN